MNEQTSQKKNPINAWIFSFFSIPITAIITFIFSAGGLNTTIQYNSKDLEVFQTRTENQITMLDSRVRTLELGMERIKVQYDNIQTSLQEIKEAVKKQ